MYDDLYVYQNWNSYALGFNMAMAIWMIVRLAQKWKKQKDERASVILGMGVLTGSIVGVLTLGWMVYDQMCVFLPETGWLPYFHGTIQILEIMTFPLLLAILYALSKVKMPKFTITKIVLSFCVADLMVFLITGLDIIWQIGVYSVLLYMVGGACVLHSNVNKYNQKLKDSYSNYNSRSTKWVLRMLLATILLLFLYLVLNVIWVSPILDILYNFISLCPWLYLYVHLSNQNFDVSVMREEPVYDSPLSLQEQRAVATTLTDALVNKLNSNTTKEIEQYEKKKLETLGTSIRRFCEDEVNFCNSRLTVNDVAKSVGTNSTYVSLWFHEQDTDFSTYITNLRLKRVERMLRMTSKPLIELIATSGFSSMSYFRKVFLEKYQCLPEHYRDNNTENRKTD